jgi:hypothetical protein
MKLKLIQVVFAGVSMAALGAYVETGSGSTIAPKNDAVAGAVGRGAKWLVSVQGKDGGWGQDGGETSYVRKGEHLESNGNDVANTAVAAIALLHATRNPEYRAVLRRALDFVLDHVERSPVEGLAVTDLTGTQIQRKLGPFIDTFLTSKLLAEMDGNMGDAQMNARVRQCLQKCVAKIEKNQLKDGSWNVAGGWAPILGTSMASRTLFIAQQKGVVVSDAAMAKVDQYTKLQQQPQVHIGGSVGAVGSGPGLASKSAVYAASAGIPLYQDAQALEQLTRSDEDRKKNADQIKTITKRFASPQYIAGFGSIGGEEFFSYLNISDSLHRAGGPEWEKWDGEMKMKLIRLQNDDGTWAGQHCITGRVAVTSAAVLLLQADRDVVLIPASAKKR